MFLSSGEIRADRRYSYAEECLAEKDFLAARDYLKEALEIAPDWLPALALLAKTLVLLNEDATEILTRLIALDKDDVFGGRLLLARLQGQTLQMSDAYITALFDDYASQFETALVQNLRYQAPDLLAEALGKLRFNRVLDVGCGTGLMAEKLLTRSSEIDGVDLSAKMVTIAAKKVIYNTLHVGDMIGFMAENKGYDLIIAADVLVYVGDLIAFIMAAHQSLLSNGTLAFTVQTFEGDGFKLGDDMRYAHSESYLKAILEPYFTIKFIQKITPRFDGGKPIAGLLIIAVI